MMCLTRQNKSNFHSTISGDKGTSNHIFFFDLYKANLGTLKGSRTSFMKKIKLLSLCVQNITLEALEVCGHQGNSTVFEQVVKPSGEYSLPLRKICRRVHDVLFYFQDCTSKNDIMCVTA